MAIIQTIRNRAGLLVSVVIGMALVAFILGDFLSSGNVSLNRAQMNIAKINGKGFSIQKFDKLLAYQEDIKKAQMGGVNTLDDKAMEEVREQTWVAILEQEVRGREYEKLGLAVSKEELTDLFFGDFLHPYIENIISQPNNINSRSDLIKYVQTMENMDNEHPDKKIYLYMEDVIYRDRLRTKYNNLIRHGLFAPSFEVESKKAEYDKNVEISYILKEYSRDKDSLISISDSEYKSYYKEHKEEYKQNGYRNLRYAKWEIIPSEQDRIDAQNWIKEVSEEFLNIRPEGTWQYVRSNSDLAPEMVNYSKEEIPERLANFAFDYDLGAVFGPYFEDEYFKLAKIVKISDMPDSVKASHILLNVDQSNINEMRALADSLKNMIENGSDFTALAMQNSKDQGSAPKGGDLGWFEEGDMVKEFSDSCFYGKTGDIKLAFSQYGIHIIKITSQSKPIKKVQVAVLARKVSASKETDNHYYTLASKFRSENNTMEKFKAAVEADKSIVSNSAGRLSKIHKRVPGIEDSRSLLRWAFSASEGDITNRVFELDNSYIVAVVEKVVEDGYIPFEEAKKIMEDDIKKEKQAEMIISEIEETDIAGLSLEEIADKTGSEVKSGTNIRFTDFTLPNLGAEPKVIGIAFNLEEGAISEPISGGKGVYIIRTDKIIDRGESSVRNIDGSFVEKKYSSKINYGLDRILNDLANVEDNRINFY